MCSWGCPEVWVFTPGSRAILLPPLKIFCSYFCLRESACHLPNSPSSDDGGWPSAPEETALLVAAENAFLLFFPKQVVLLPSTLCLEKTTQLQRGRLPAPNPHSNVMTHTNPNHLVSHVLKHSAQWCVKTDCPIQLLRLRVSHWLEAEGMAETEGLLNIFLLLLNIVGETDDFLILS